MSSRCCGLPSERLPYWMPNKDTLWTWAYFDHRIEIPIRDAGNMTPLNVDLSSLCHAFCNLVLNCCLVCLVTICVYLCFVTICELLATGCPKFPFYLSIYLSINWIELNISIYSMSYRVNQCWRLSFHHNKWPLITFYSCLMGRKYLTVEEGIAETRCTPRSWLLFPLVQIWMTIFPICTDMNDHLCTICQILLSEWLPVLRCSWCKNGVKGFVILQLQDFFYFPVFPRNIYNIQRSGHLFGHYFRE